MTTSGGRKASEKQEINMNIDTTKEFLRKELDKVNSNEDLRRLMRMIGQNLGLVPVDSNYITNIQLEVQLWRKAWDESDLGTFVNSEGGASENWDGFRSALACAKSQPQDSPPTPLITFYNVRGRIIIDNLGKDKVAAELRKHYNGENWLGEIIEAFEDHHEGMYRMFINQHKEKILSSSVSSILKPFMLE